jgi:hypothetical protein
LPLPVVDVVPVLDAAVEGVTAAVVVVDAELVAGAEVVATLALEDEVATLAVEAALAEVVRAAEMDTVVAVPVVLAVVATAPPQPESRKTPRMAMREMSERTWADPFTSQEHNSTALAR